MFTGVMNSLLRSALSIQHRSSRLSRVIGPCACASRQVHSNMSKPKVLLTRGDLPPQIINLLKEKCDLDVWPHAYPITREELLKRVSGVHGLYCLLTDKIDEEVLSHAGSQLKVIATMSVGYDHLNVPAIKSRGIKIGYTPGVLTSATAELTLALTLATTRRLFEAHETIVDGSWSKCAWSPFWMCSDGLIGTKVGIVGLGRIGLAIAKRLIPFEVSKIMYTGNRPKPEAAEVSAEFVPFDQLLKESDVIIISCALTDQTKGMFGPAAFAAMKPTSVLINTSRGGIVDQEALIHALKAGQIAAAGLDVMTPEPLPADHELTKLKNCVLIPHIGSATVQTRTAMAMLTARNVIAALEDERMPAELL